MSEIKTLLTQSSHYLVGRIIMMAAGFISFPLLTRIFSVSDYGLLGLITTTLLIAMGITKLGLPESIVRFYAEYKSTNRLTNFYSTLLLTSMAASAIIAILFYIAAQFMHNILDKNILNLVPLLSILIFTGCTITILTSFLRADQRTKLWNVIEIIYRYGALSLSILMVLFYVRNLYGFYIGQIISGVAMLFFLLYIFRKKIKISLESFSPDVFKSSIKFGFPLIFAELSHLVLNYADRYLIQLYLGSISLGLYIAGYNLATYVSEMIMYPINYAMTPIYMNLLVNKGEGKTREFFTKTFRYFLLIMFPVAFGFIAIGKNLLIFLASEKYIDAYVIIPYVVIGQLIYACSIILNNGLFIRKKTHILNNVMIVFCLLNIGLNIILIPRFGIVGAAQATLISYFFYTLVITYYAFKEFSFPIDYRRIILYLGASLVMFMTVKNIHIESHFLNLASQIVIGIIIYSWLVIIGDKEFRRNLLSFANSLKK